MLSLYKTRVFITLSVVLFGELTLVFLWHKQVSPRQTELEKSKLELQNANADQNKVNLHMHLSPSTLAESLKNSSETGECPAWQDRVDWTSAVEPWIKLDNSKFLFPFLVFGPNNQLLELWSAIYMAIRLNRTLVLPTFLKHKSMEAVQAHRRINVNRLRRLVSTTSMEKFQKSCKRMFGAVFQTYKIRLNVLRMLEDVSGMSFNLTREANNLSRNAFIEPSQLREMGFKVFSQSPFNENHFLSSSASSLRKVFNSTDKCALLISPLRAFNLPRNKFLIYPNHPKLVTPLNPALLPDEVLYSTVVREVRRPLCVEMASDLFVETVLGNRPFVSVHWRYENDDWMKVHCGNSKQISDNKKSKCGVVSQANAFEVADKIKNFLRKRLYMEQRDRKGWNQLREGVTVHVAHPSSAENFVNKVTKFLLRDDARKSRNVVSRTLTGSDVREFTNKRLGNCLRTNGWKDTEDFISMLEMEICVRSHWFFYSQLSSWSSNVLASRIGKLQYESANDISLLQF